MTGAPRGERARALRAAPVAIVALALGACAMLPGGDRRAASVRPTPIADRPIDLDGNCMQTDEAGFREQATLVVRDSVVHALSWRLWVGRRGQCSFEQADFRQTQRRPHIELLARDGSGCRLMVWQDPRRVTLAHGGCERYCTPGIYDEAWPVMFDARSGGCARP